MFKMSKLEENPFDNVKVMIAEFQFITLKRFLVIFQSQAVTQWGRRLASIRHDK